MDAQQRRQAIARRLSQAGGPVSAAALARELSVSRQIIVGDVALLRAGGLEITATPRGYLLPEPGGVRRTFACRHRPARRGHTGSHHRGGHGTRREGSRLCPQPERLP